MSNLRTNFFASQSPGKRDYQEDDYGLLDARESGSEDSEHTVIVVADGMGGHVGGDMASSLVTEHFIEAYQNSVGTIPERLELALQAANAALTAAISDNAALKGMGSTLVAAVISDAKLYWISVGDSPLWLFRHEALQRLNADHSMTPVLQQMVADGRITQAQADADPGRHSLLSVLMGDAIELIDLRTEAITLNDDDLVLLSSDGLLTLSAEKITAILTRNSDQSVASLVANLHKAVADVAYPNQDNITITLYRANSQSPSPLPLPNDAVKTESNSAKLAAPRGDRRVPNSYLRLLLPACLLVLILAGYLFSRLRTTDSAELAPVIAVPGEAAAEVVPQPEPVPPANVELPAATPVQNSQQLPVVELPENSSGTARIDP